MFNKIVIGLDGSEASENALRIACDMAQKYNSELHIVHTPQPQTVAFAMGAVAGYHAVTTMPSAAEVEESCAIVLNKAVSIAQLYNQKIKQTHTNQGDPAQQIIACAESCGADLIVTGRRGLGSIRSLVQGSTSLQVNHLAKCAYLSAV
jgi:nucleotide-binding universal stress UspA family protein